MSTKRNAAAFKRKRDEIKAFCDDLYRTESQCLVAEDTGKPWERFFGRWFLCRFRFLGKEVDLTLQVDDESRAVVYAYSDQQGMIDDGSHRAPESRLSDLIAAAWGMNEGDELVAAIRRECDDGILRLVSRLASESEGSA